MLPESEAEFKEQLAAREQYISHLQRIIQVSQTLNTTLDLDPLLETIVEVATELTETVGAAILLLERDTGELRFRVATGPNRDGLIGQTVPLESSIAGAILRENRPLLVQNPQQDPRFFRGMDQRTAFQTLSVIGVPLQVKGQVIGVLEAVNKRDEQEMSWADVEVLAILADQAAIAIENARLYDDVRRMKEFNEELVNSLAEGVIVTDAQGYISFVNPAAAALWGYSSSDLVGQHWMTVMPPEHHSVVAAAIERRERGETDRYQLELVRRSGERTPVMVSGSPLFEADGGVFVGSVAIFTDITEALAHQRIEQELALAWQIQSSFLPDQVPEVPGWQVAATLNPARQTSGDFYDLIPLLNGRLGILIADVAGKGTGAALYMAVSRTLLRTYAIEFHAQPELAFRAANSRILMDTHVDLFVTVFYGVLDPVSGRFTYCNAGHSPPYLFRANDGKGFETLSRTGLPLGVFNDLVWEQKTVQMAPGDLLVLYTDGITDVDIGEGRLFGHERLRQVAQANVGRSAHQVQEALMTDVYQFIGDTSYGQRDDIALVVVVRSSSGQSTAEP